MSILLSDRQKDDLHKAMLDYLFSSGYKNAYNGLKEELPNLSEHQPDADAKTTGILVKKWTSIIRMQKKIMDLDARLQQALEDNERMPAGPSKKFNEDWIPVGKEKHVLSGHRGRVNALSFHPRYSVIATASEDTTLKVWDWESGELERTLKGHTRHVKDCEFDSKGTNLVSCAEDMFIKLWKVDEDYQNFATLRGHEHSISSARFMPNDTHIVSASRDNSVRLWEIATTHCVKVFHPHDDWIRQAVPSPDGKFILTTSNDQTARIMDAETGAVKSEMRGHEHILESAVFAPPNIFTSLKELVDFIPLPSEGSRAGVPAVSVVATASRDKTIKLWDALRGRLLWTFVGHEDWVHRLVFHPSGKYLMSTGDDKTLRTWDLKNGRCMRTVADAHSQFIQCMSWGRQPAAVTSDKPNDGKGGQNKEDLQVARPINVIATGSWDKNIKIWYP